MTKRRIRVPWLVAVVATVAAPGTRLAPDDAPADAPALKDLAGLSPQWSSPPLSLRPLQIVHGLHPRGLRWEGIQQVLHGQDPEKKVAAGVEAYLSLGLGGIVCNVDFKGYMKSEDAWKTLAAGVDTCAKLGMTVWLYDEDGYPSGAAGGLVLEENPAFEATVLAFDPSLSDPFTVRRAYEHTHASNNFYASRRYVNIMDDRAVRSFIAHTHEAYRQRLGRHLGHAVEAVFTDEPSLLAVNTGQLPESVRKTVRVKDPVDSSVKPLPAVPWSYDIVDRYRERYGEDLLERRRSLFEGDSADDRRVRRQFWGLVGDLVASRYFGQIQDWCSRHDIASSGHGLWEEAILHHVGLQGNALKTLTFMDIPGLDALSSNPEAVIHGGWMTAALPSSAALLMGRRRVMTEVSDFVEKMGGVGPASLAEMQATAAWQATWGVTDFTLYYAVPDRPAAEYRAYCDYVGRLNAVLRTARLDPEVLLYYPIHDLWAEYLPVAGPLSEESQSARARRIVSSFQRLGMTLERSQIPFALVDHEFIAGAAVSSDGRLRIRDRTFRALILPEECVLPEKAAATVEAFRQSGGQVLCDGLGAVLSGTSLIEALDPACRLDPVSERVVLGAFAREGRSVLLLVNVGRDAYAGTLVTRATGAWSILDPSSGAGRALDTADGRLPFSLAPRQAAILVGPARAAALSPETPGPDRAGDDFSWIRGANYVPSYARNDVQIWMDYDPAVIDRELGYAERLQLNTIRLFLQVAVYERDPKRFLDNLENLLSLCDKHGIRLMPVLFDSCFGEFPDLERYRDRDWMACPGQNRLGAEHWPAMEKYVRDVVGGHKSDRRVAMWDVMNEPTCTRFYEKEEGRKLIHAFLGRFLDYVREQGPTQPLTVGLMASGELPMVLDKVDVLGFHNYTRGLREDIRGVKDLGRKHGKAAVINEVARRPGQPFSFVMPILREEKIGWCFWELMLSKTEFSRGDNPIQGVIYPDGTCRDASEIAHILGVGLEEARKLFPERPRPKVEEDGITFTGFWTRWTGAGPRKDRLFYANVAGCRADLTFRGASVALVHKIGPDCGVAAVLIDGKPATRPNGGALEADASGRAILDTYGPEVDWNRRTVLAEKLPAGPHTVSIDVTGLHRDESSDAYVQIVGFEAGE